MAEAGGLPEIQINEAARLTHRHPDRPVKAFLFEQDRGALLVAFDELPVPNVKELGVKFLRFVPLKSVFAPGVDDHRIAGLQGGDFLGG